MASKIKDDTNVVRSKEWTLTRNGKVVTLTGTGQANLNRRYKREYKSEHAANCAIGRARHSVYFINQLVKSLEVEKITGRRPNQYRSPTKLSAEHVLAYVMSTYGDKLKDDKKETMEQLIKRVVNNAGDGFRRGDSFDLRGVVRTLITNENRKEA